MSTESQRAVQAAITGGGNAIWLENRQLDDEALELLASGWPARSIADLNLSGNNFTARGIKALCDRLPKAGISYHIDLSGNNIGGEEPMGYLSKALPKMGVGNLSLMSCGITDATAHELLACLPRTSITRLNLCDNDISWDVLDKVAKVLRANKDRTTKHKSGTALTEKIIQGIKDGSVIDLDLSGKYLSISDLTTLANLLANNHTVRSLNLRETMLGDDGAAIVARILEENSAIERLNLGVNGIGTLGTSRISAALETNRTLRELDFSYNQIGRDGGKTIAQALYKNRSLHTLDLTYCLVGPGGTKALVAALKKDDSVGAISLGDNKIGDEGAIALADLLQSTSSLHELSVNGDEFGDTSTKALLKAIAQNRTLTKLHIGNVNGDGIAHSLEKSVRKSGNRNLHTVYPRIDAVEDLIRPNLRIYDVVFKIEDASAPLVTLDKSDFQAIKNAPYGFISAYLGRAEHTVGYVSPKDVARLLSRVQEAASAHDVEIELSPYYKRLTQEVLREDDLKRLDIEAKQLLKRISAIADTHSVSVEEMMGSNPPKPLALDDIESMIAFAQAKPNQPAPELSNVTQARIELVNNVIIPHIDYFVISALRTADNAEAVDFASYPNIQRVAGTQYDLSKFKQQARSRQSAEGGLKFDYLHDESQGDHMTRLRRALKEVDGTIGEHEATFKRIEAEIADIYLKIDQSRGLADEKGKYLADAKKGNEFRTDRMHEYSIRANSARLSAEVRNQERAKATFGQTVSYWLAKGTQGVPFLEGITEAIAEHAGHPNFGNNRALIRATSAAAKVDADAAEVIIEYYQGKQIDTDAIEREIKIVRAGINKMQQDQGFKRLEQDKTKQKAIAEAFVNKLMLNYGRHMSEGLLSVCEEHGIEQVDDFFAAFKGDPRLHEAFTNLCFGYADSNDLSVIFAEVAGMKGDEPAQAAAREYVERVLKPNISDLYAHASKVDLIYQANLSSLGTDLHNARHMIRSEHDMRVRALFGDSFGVDSQMGALTVRGAVDVKNLFDYYMHRHGKTTLTDTKIHDGLVTGNKAPKRVSLLDDTAMVEHKELAKASRGYRQDGPDVSDMFLRICGYEYFVPQAPNDAQRSNIMANNPEAPASYQMANRVVKEFIQKLSFAHIDDYRAKVGTTDKAPSKLDNLMAQTFMDFFSEVGAIHAADPKLGGKRADLKAASKETGTFGFAFDSYERLITKDALGRFDLFLEIYKRNLEVILRDGSVADGKLLRDQIAAVAELTQHQLNPKVVEPGSEQDRHQARLANHNFANTHWRGVA